VERTVLEVQEQDMGLCLCLARAAGHRASQSLEHMGARSPVRWEVRDSFITTFCRGNSPLETPIHPFQGQGPQSPHRLPLQEVADHANLHFWGAQRLTAVLERSGFRSVHPPADDMRLIPWCGCASGAHVACGHLSSLLCPSFGFSGTSH
jgi:hypothetical protein